MAGAAGAFQLRLPRVRLELGDVHRTGLVHVRVLRLGDRLRGQRQGGGHDSGGEQDGAFQHRHGSFCARAFRPRAKRDRRLGLATTRTKLPARIVRLISPDVSFVSCFEK